MTAREPSDRELLQACRAGDDGAARLLHARLAPALTGYARKILHDRAAADDAVQSAMLAALKQPQRRLAEVHDVKSWMIRLVRNEALMQLRTDRRARVREENHVRDAQRRLRATTPGGQPDELADAIDALPVKHREIVVLRFLSGLTFEQVAAAMDENRNTIASRYRNAIAKLRELLGEAADGPAPTGDATKREAVSNG